MMEAGLGPDAALEYLSELEGFSGNSIDWELIRDDSIAFTLLRAGCSREQVEFYKGHRDSLAEPIASLDWQAGEAGWSLSEAMDQLIQHEPLVEELLEKEELGVFGIGAILSHGTLLEVLHQGFDVNPTEAANVLHLNAGYIEYDRQSPDEIGDTARRLAHISAHESTVWLAAQETPLALRFYQDAKGVATDVLEAFAADDVVALLYDRFGDDLPALRAAATAVKLYGDLAIFIFSRYDEPAYTQKIREALVDPDGGPRVVPFLVLFDEDGFNKLDEDKGYIDRYFNEDGTIRVDEQEWIASLPGGALIQVGRNYAKDYPCEWSELGWAALDVAQIGAAVVTFGGSSAATVAARTGNVGAKSALRSGGRSAVKGAAKAGTKGASRTKATEAWMKKLRRVAEGVGRSEVANSRLARMSASLLQGSAKSVLAATWIASKGLWVSKGAMSVGKSCFSLSRKAGRFSLTHRRAIARAGLAIGLTTTIVTRTLPNAEAINDGFSSLLRDVTSGTVQFLTSAVAGAVSGVVDAAVGVHSPLRYGSFFFALLAVFYVGVLPQLLVLWSSRRSRRRPSQELPAGN